MPLLQPGFHSPADYAEVYRNELIENILPFWLTHSIDEKHGGYFTCLDRQGRVYDTDKFIWLQGRQVWTFSFMYHFIGPDKRWLETAVAGAEFLKRHGRDEAGNWYFSLTAGGKPLSQPHNIFSDCFAAMAFASLARIVPDSDYGGIARQTFDNILRRKDNWKGIYEKSYPGTRPLRSFALPMILANLSLEMEHLIGGRRVDEFIPALIHEILGVFYKPDLGLVSEYVGKDGELVDCFEGRLLNPGHSIEAMWFLMDLGKRIGDDAVIAEAVSIMLHTLEYGWDQEYGGIFYFLDRRGFPPQQLEWDQKLWWVHVESLVALAKGYAYTGNPRCMEWFEKVHQYTWQRFRDPEYGEWFGYLNRRGEVLLDAKGGKWKGCFHVPRGLYQVWQTLK